jgi:hypothetical protein
MKFKLLFVLAALAATAMAMPAQAGGPFYRQGPNVICPVGVVNPHVRIPCPPPRYGGRHGLPQQGRRFFGGFVIFQHPPRVQVQTWHSRTVIRQRTRIEWHVRCITGTNNCWYVSP